MIFVVFLVLLVFLCFMAFLVILCKYYRNRGRYPKNIFFGVETISSKKTKEEIHEIMNKSVYESESELKEEYDVVIIGSGISSCVAAAFLSRAGKKVLLLEKHDRLGGYGHMFEEGDYEFCAGVHYMCRLDQTLFKNVLRLISDNTFEFTQLDDMTEVYEIGGEIVNIKGGGFGDYKKALFAAFPEEKDSLEKYFGVIEKVESSFAKFIVARNVPWYIKLLFKIIRFDKDFHNYGPKNGRDVLNECGVKNPALRFLLLSVQALYNTNGDDYCCFPVHAVISKIYNRKFMPVGGGPSLIRSIMSNLKNDSVGICNAEVKKILRHKKTGSVVGVELQDGKRVFCDKVISSCGLENTLSLLPHSKNLEINHLLKKHRLYNGKLFSIFMILDATVEELEMKGIGCYVWSGSREWSNFNDLKSLDPSSDFSGFDQCGFVYMTNIDQYDPSFIKNHPGKTKITVFSILNDEWFSKFEGTRTKQRGNEYEEIKECYENRILEVIYNKFPKMEDNVEMIVSGTNLTCLEYGSWPEGSCYGLTLTYSKLCDFIGNDKVINPFEGLYMVGQDILGPGCSLAALSSFFAVGKILGRNLFKDSMDFEKFEENNKMKHIKNT